MISLLSLALLASSVQGQLAADCGLEPPGSVPIVPVPARPNVPAAWLPGEPGLVRRVEAPRAIGPRIFTPSHERGGALAGKTIYISAGHGFVWLNGLNEWTTQRATTTNGSSIIEDLVSAEAVNQFLIPYLQNAGATVVPVREPDLMPEMVIVDDRDPGYVESGATGLFSDSTLPGWGRMPEPLNDGDEPFAAGRNRLMVTDSVETARATFTPNLPREGDYNVYVSYVQYMNRPMDAHFIVRHAGGQTHFRINERHHGGTWVLLGQFHFKAGTQGAVIAANDSATSGAVMSVDAVRFGGGRGIVKRGTATSGRPRYEEAARYNVLFSGAPLAVYHPLTMDMSDDVSARSRFAGWLYEPGEDAVYIAWHSNSPSPAVGTETYVYGYNPPNGTYQFAGAPGADKLGRAVHDEIIRDLRNGWNPGWTDRGLRSAYFGELDPGYNPSMPACLVEVAFHDTLSDAMQLREPKFRRLVTRAMADGIIKYFAARDSLVVRLPPEIPEAVVAKAVGPKAVLDWMPPPVDAKIPGSYAATSYRVYQSSDGLSWDDGTDSQGQTHFEVGGLTPGVPRYFRVAALNGAGESFPSPVLGVAMPADGRPPLLAVEGFDRLDSGLMFSENLSAYYLGQVMRFIWSKANDGSYLRQPGDALAALKIGFDSCTRAALAQPASPNQLVSFRGYRAVGWFAGRQNSSPSSPAFTAAEQAALDAYLSAGGGVLVSGTELARSLAAGSAADQSFLSNVLRVQAAGTVSSYQVVPVAGGLFDGLLPLTLDNGGGDTYDTSAADALQPAAGLAADVAAANWTGPGGTSALAIPGAGRLVYWAFPVETITDSQVRRDWLRRALEFVDPPALRPFPASLPPVEAAPLISIPPPEPEVPGHLVARGCACGSSERASAAPLLAGLLALGLVLRREKRHSRWLRV